MIALNIDDFVFLTQFGLNFCCLFGLFYLANHSDNLLMKLQYFKYIIDFDFIDFIFWPSFDLKFIPFSTLGLSTSK